MSAHTPGHPRPVTPYSLLEEGDSVTYTLNGGTDTGAGTITAVDPVVVTHEDGTTQRLGRADFITRDHSDPLADALRAIALASQRLAEIPYSLRRLPEVETSRQRQAIKRLTTLVTEVSAVVGSAGERIDGLDDAHAALSDAHAALVIRARQYWPRPKNTNTVTAETVPALTWSLVRGESPGAHAVEPGPHGIDVPDEVLDWTEKHGDEETYLLVTPESEAGEVAGEVPLAVLVGGFLCV